ncbi:MAG: two-component regulator propeller domain-containing protein, partial [Bacteroidota bacterium]
MSKYDYTLLLICLFLTVARSQSVPHLNLKQLSTKDGLSHRQVHCIHQDQLGFIWVGTAYGLNRYDGYEFKWWTKEVDGLTSNKINNITEDAEGYLWLISQGGHQASNVERIKSIDLLHPVTQELISWETKFQQQLPFPLTRINSDIRTVGDDQTLYFGTGEGANLISYHPRSG